MAAVLRHSDTPEAWDCNREDHRRCLKRNLPLECQMPAGGSRRFHVTSVAGMNAAIAEVSASMPKLDDITICLHMGVCPAGLFDMFSLEAWRLHNAVKGGAPWPWPGGYYDQPAVFARARDVFESESAIIEAESQRRKDSRGE